MHARCLCNQLRFVLCTAVAHTSHKQALGQALLSQLTAEPEKLPFRMQKLLEGAANAPENGIYFQGQPEGRLLSWPYVNKNTMYYDSSEQALVPLTDAERAAQVQVLLLLCLISAMYRTSIPQCMDELQAALEVWLCSCHCVVCIGSSAL